jgi:hypothetical protein
MQQTTTAEVHLDEGKAKSCSAMRPAPDRLGRSQQPSWAELLPTHTMPFVRAAIWGFRLNCGRKKDILERVRSEFELNIIETGRHECRVISRRS